MCQVLSTPREGNNFGFQEAHNPVRKTIIGKYVCKFFTKTRQ